MKKLIFINSHPIQYFAPLYSFLNENGLPTACWYCSDESVKESHDAEFGVKVKWDIPLLQGYSYRFFKNYSPKPSVKNGFFGLMNFGMVPALFREPKSVVVIHGWHYFSHLLILLLAKTIGHTVCFRFEMPQNQEVLRGGWKQKARRWFMRKIVFPRINYFLYIGTQNYLLYKDYGIEDQRLLFCPYSVDNRRFRLEWQRLQPRIPDLKRALGIPPEEKVILYSGKYIDKKRPLDLIEAYSRLNEPRIWLIMVGEGELRADMEQLIAQKRLKNVILTGFINQSKVAEYYTISDVFVMCSTVGETWGLSVNEALNFGLPVIVSDITGCSTDLVQEGINGFVFKTGDPDDLSNKLKRVLDSSFKNKVHEESVLDKWSYVSITKNMLTLV